MHCVPLGLCAPCSWLSLSLPSVLLSPPRRSNYVEAVASTATSPTAVPPPPRAVGPPPVPVGARAASPPARGAVGLQAVSNEQKQEFKPAGPAPSSSSSTLTKPSASTAASSSAAPVRSEKLRDSKTKFGLWSSNMALYSAISQIVFGVMGFIWYDQKADPEPIVSNPFTLYCSLYSFFLGFLILAWEHYFGRKRGPSPLPARGLAYTVLSLFLFMSWPTLLCGFFLFTTAFFNFVASALGEVYDAPVKPAVAAIPKKPEDEAAEGVWGAIKIFFASIRQQNKVGQACFMFAYVGGNIALFIYTLILWINKVGERVAA